jgi:hypothetical protein
MRIRAGNDASVAKLANLTVDVKNSVGDEVDVSVIFRYVSTQPAQLMLRVAISAS